MNVPLLEVSLVFALNGHASEEPQRLAFYNITEAIQLLREYSKNVKSFKLSLAGYDVSAASLRELFKIEMPNIETLELTGEAPGDEDLDNLYRPQFAFEGGYPLCPLDGPIQLRGAVHEAWKDLTPPNLFFFNHFLVFLHCCRESLVEIKIRDFLHVPIFAHGHPPEANGVWTFRRLQAFDLQDSRSRARVLLSLLRISQNVKVQIVSTGCNSTFEVEMLREFLPQFNPGYNLLMLCNPFRLAFSVNEECVEVAVYNSEGDVEDNDFSSIQLRPSYEDVLKRPEGRSAFLVAMVSAVRQVFHVANVQQLRLSGDCAYLSSQEHWTCILEAFTGLTDLQIAHTGTEEPSSHRVGIMEALAIPKAILYRDKMRTLPICPELDVVVFTGVWRNEALLTTAHHALEFRKKSKCPVRSLSITFRGEGADLGGIEKKFKKYVEDVQIRWANGTVINTLKLKLRRRA